MQTSDRHYNHVIGLATIDLVWILFAMIVYLRIFLHLSHLLEFRQLNLNCSHSRYYRQGKLTPNTVGLWGAEKGKI